ncbi:MAG: hypothetical protein LBI72_12980 [Flavobacteriaceae bacterium]|jgi:hypothetical protein|nr:hypothetical protein [Flavobacteriaceae bacterium]
MKQEDVLLAMIPAFFGVIDTHIRAIAYDYTEDTIALYVYLSSIPTEDDYEAVDISITEIMASLSNLKYQHITITQDLRPISELNAYKGWFYVKKQ